MMPSGRLTSPDHFRGEYLTPIREFEIADLAEPVRRGLRAGGATPIDFNTIVVSDGITMGAEGMRASLISREAIADSIELAVRGHSLDGAVVLVGCDKTIPAAAMALARLDIPGVIFYGGTILPGRCDGRDVSIQDVFEAVGAHAAGAISDAELDALERAACPGAGAAPPVRCRPAPSAVRCCPRPSGAAPGGRTGTRSPAFRAAPRRSRRPTAR